MFNALHRQCCCLSSCRNPAAGFAPSQRSPASAPVAKTRLIGNAGSSCSLSFLMMSRSSLSYSLVKMVSFLLFQSIDMVSTSHWSSLLSGKLKVACFPFFLGIWSFTASMVYWNNNGFKFEWESGCCTCSQRCGKRAVRQAYHNLCSGNWWSWFLAKRWRFWMWEWKRGSLVLTCFWSIVACAKEHKVCAKCSCRVEQIVGRFVMAGEFYALVLCWIWLVICEVCFLGTLRRWRVRREHWMRWHYFSMWLCFSRWDIVWGKNSIAYLFFTFCWFCRL